MTLSDSIMAYYARRKEFCRLLASNSNYEPRRDVNYILAQTLEDARSSAEIDFEMEKDTYRGQRGYFGPYGDFVIPLGAADAYTRLQGLKRKTLIYKGFGWAKVEPSDLFLLTNHYEMIYPTEVFR